MRADTEEVYGMYRDPHGGRRFLVALALVSALVIVGGILIGRAKDPLGFMVVLIIAAATLVYALFRASG